MRGLRLQLLPDGQGMVGGGADQKAALHRLPGERIASAWALILPTLCVAPGRSRNFSRRLSFPNCKMGMVTVPLPEDCFVDSRSYDRRG